MRAVTIDSAETPPALREDLPAPAPADTEVLVRVHASSVNPVDNAIAAGMLAGMGVEHEYPVIPGRDYAGVVEQAGAAVSGYRPSDDVFGFLLHANPTVHDGAWAELITVAEEQSIAPVPDGVELAVAGAAPLAGITAMTAVDALDLSEGDVLLVAGARRRRQPRRPARRARRAPASSRRRCPRMRTSCATSASPTCCRATATSRARARPRPRRRRCAAGPRQLRARQLRRGAQARRARRLTDRRRRRRARPHQRDGRAEPENLQRLGALLADGTLRIPVQATYELAAGARGARRAGRRAHPGQADDSRPLSRMQLGRVRAR